MTADQHFLSLGFSPCPNDTFIFHALVEGLVDTGELAFQPPVLEDVETLNRWALEGKLDVSKVSFYALGHLLDTYVLLRAGAALGRGCGPLLVAAKPYEPQDLPRLRVAIPGNYTTAGMLLRLYAPNIDTIVVMPFDRIMASISQGVVDAGVIIHESRFTYPEKGLRLILDLGAWWEAETGRPIPLGGIVARRSLGEPLLRSIEKAVRASVGIAFKAPDASRPFVLSHAQEMETSVVEEHIALYVNRFSEDLGDEGVAAVEEFLERGAEAGLFPRPVADGIVLPVGD